MKILVTGGSGFIGSNFILYWLDNHPDDSIINLDNLTYAGNPENLKKIERDKRYRFIRGDICDRDAVKKAIGGTDTVIHFAAESHVDRSILDASVFVRTNCLGTQILLEAAVQAKIKRFHHISTDEVFGSLELSDPSKFNEESHYRPSSPYAASKAGSDHMVRAYFRSYGLPVTITNCSNNYGPYQFPEKFIPLAITNLLEGKKIPLYGDGLNVRDWLFVEDHCRAIDAVLSRGKVGETYCVGGLTEAISNLDIAKKILGYLCQDETHITYVKDRPGHDRKYAIDWTKIHRELGWSPRSEFDTYLQKTVKWYCDNEEWWKRVKSGAYLDYYARQYGVIS